MSFTENLTLLLLTILGGAALYLLAQNWWPTQSETRRHSVSLGLLMAALVGGALLVGTPYTGDLHQVPGGAHPSGDPLQKIHRTALQP